MRDIVIAGKKYTKRDGTQGTEWIKVGAMGTSQAGKDFLLLDPRINLAGFDREPGKDLVMCSIVDRNNNQQGQQPQQNQGYNQNQQQQPVQQNYNQPQQQQIGVTQGGAPIVQDQYRGQP